MELVNMLLNQLTNKPINNTANSNNKGTGFNDFLNKAESKVENKPNNINNNKSYKDNKDNNKVNNKTKDLSDKEATTLKQKDKVQSNESTKVEEKNNIDKIDNDTEKAIIVEEDILNKLSEILGISNEQVMDILSSLSMSISMLQDNQNLIKFLQSAFDVESPVELLAINNIKDIMKDITDIAKSIDYTDLISLDENAKGKITEIINKNNLKDVTLLSSTTDIKKKIDALLEELNGSVEETNVLEDINLENTDQLVNVEDVKNIKAIDGKVGYHQENNQNMNNSQNQSLVEMLKQNNLELTSKQELFNIGEVANNSTKVYNTSLPKTQVLRNINTTDIVNQIMEKIKVSIKPEISEVKMILKPEQLGEVSLKIATQNGIVTAQFIAENQKVKEIIESNFKQLKDMLNEQGIDVGALEVNVSGDESQETTYNMFDQSTNKNERMINNLTEEIIEKENIVEVKEENILNSQVNYSI